MNLSKIRHEVHPNNFKIKLFPHQLETIYNMEKLEKEKIVEYDSHVKETKIGIVADKSGYGKTMSVLGLIANDKMEWDIEVPFNFEIISNEANGLIKKKIITHLERLPCTLILISSSILHQWEQEIKKTQLKYISITKKKDIEELNVYKYDIVLVLNTMYNNLIKTYFNHVWKRFIFDEPGHVRVSGMQEVKAGFYWFITSTPNSISIYHQNCRGSFIKNIIGDYMFSFEEQFNGFIIKNDPDFINLSFNMPPTYYHYYQCYNPIYNTVKGLIDTRIIKMIEGDNIKGAILALGGKNTKNIIELVKRKKQEELISIKKNINIYTIRQDTDKIKDLEKKYQIKVNEINDLQLRFTEQLRNMCSICHEPLKKPILETNCHNIFCGKCLLQWMKDKETCPLCRKTIYNVDLIYLSEEVEDKAAVKINKILTKNQQILKIINKKNSSFIIFSDYQESFAPISNILNENNITFLTLKGNYKERENVINKYKDGDIQVIFIHSHFDCAGINLENTTDIILYHELNKNTKKQIISRAERIGRKNSLTVHQLYI